MASCVFIGIGDRVLGGVRGVWEVLEKFLSTSFLSSFQSPVCFPFPCSPLIPTTRAWCFLKSGNQQTDNTNINKHICQIKYWEVNQSKVQKINNIA